MGEGSGSRLQKTGKTLTTVGAVTLGASVLTILAFGNQMGMEGVLFGYSGLAGLGIMAVGIPMKITGKNRVERINALKNTASNAVSYTHLTLPTN